MHPDCCISFFHRMQILSPPPDNDILRRLLRRCREADIRQGYVGDHPNAEAPLSRIELQLLIDF